MLRLSKMLCVVPALLALGVVGCGSDRGGDAGSAEGTFVGTVEDTDAYIALVSDGGHVAGYVCDGGRRGIDVSTWLDSSQISDDRAELVSRQGKRLGFVHLEDDAASGTVSVGKVGKEYGFSAEQATGDAGLYRVTRAVKVELLVRATGRRQKRTVDVEAGWIVLNDGSQRGATDISDPNFPALKGVPNASNLNQVRPGPFIDPTTQAAVQVPGAGELRPKKFVDPVSF